MPRLVSSLLDLKSISQEQVHSLFSLAKKLKSTSHKVEFSVGTLALLFFEPSTRTRMSFETAGHRIGLGALLFSGENSSLEKGETIEDTTLNIAAMNPRAMVIRCGAEVDLADLASQVSCPVINAGWGVSGHPTQALLDIFTIEEHFGSLAGKKLLIVGDIKHSRVASSHFELAKILGLEIGICGPEEFMVNSPGVQIFKKLSDGLQWADAAMALRFQFERHSNDTKLSKENYIKNFGLSSQTLKDLKNKGAILHPGPINQGLEMESEVRFDERSLVLKQVTNGVYIREALLRTVLGVMP